MDLAIVIAVVVVALSFDYTNGFHDAENAIATSISTRALTPRIALILAAVMNFVGAALTAGAVVHWSTIDDKVVIPMVASPVVGFLLAFLVMLAIMWIF
ncbi:MAG: phosphate transporter, partial [Nocardioides sp.]|nr:phosphate transporter [Nocardioides sp.]